MLKVTEFGVGYLGAESMCNIKLVLDEDIISWPITTTPLLVFPTSVTIAV